MNPMADKADSGDSLAIKITKVNGCVENPHKIRLFVRNQLALAICNLVFFSSAFAQTPGEIPPASPISVSDTALRVIQLMNPSEIHWNGESGEEQQFSSLVGPKRPEWLRSLANSADPSVRASWLEQAIDCDSRAALDATTRALSDPDPKVRAAAADALLRCNVESVDKALWRWLHATSFQERETASDVLPRLTPMLQAKLIRRLEDDQEPVAQQTAAAYLLGRMGVSAAAEALASRAWTRDPALAVECADAISRVADASQVEVLQSLTAHPVPEVRAAVAEGAANIGGIEGIALLEHIAVNPVERSIEVRRAAVHALGQIREPETVHALIRVLHRRRDIHRETIQSLYAVTHLPLDNLAGSWIGWYEEIWRPNPVWPIPVPDISKPDPQLFTGDFAP